MAQYQAISFTTNEQPPTSKWNIIGTNFVYMQNALPPVGSVLGYWGDSGSVPGYWKLADGSAVSDAESPIDGLTLPNLVSRYVRYVTGNVRTSPVSGGSDTHTLSVAELPAHSHAVTVPLYVNTGLSGSGINLATLDGTGSGGSLSSSSVGSGSAFSILPSYVGLVPIIRYK